MDKNEYVYCTNCLNFRLCDEGLPYCFYENKCDINGFDYSKSFSERPYYEEIKELIIYKEEN